MHTSKNASVFINTLYDNLTPLRHYDYAHSHTTLFRDVSLHRDGDDPVPHDLVEMSQNNLQGFDLQYLYLKCVVMSSHLVWPFDVSIAERAEPNNFFAHI